jgi:hypothetical protein
MSERVAHGGVARDGLDPVDRALVGSALERSLHASMLVPERDLEMDHALAVALETEMPRLDHARVHGPDPYLVDLLTLDLEEVGDPRNQRITLPPVPGITTRPVRPVVSDRFEPRMPLGAHTPLLRDLAFEKVRLRQEGRERRVALRHVG